MATTNLNFCLIILQISREFFFWILKTKLAGLLLFLTTLNIKYLVSDMLLMGLILLLWFDTIVSISLAALKEFEVWEVHIAYHVYCVGCTEDNMAYHVYPVCLVHTQRTTWPAVCTRHTCSSVLKCVDLLSLHSAASPQWFPVSSLISTHHSALPAPPLGCWVLPSRHGSL